MQTLGSLEAVVKGGRLRVGPDRLTLPGEPGFVVFA
jgi:hypothetical protein